MRCFLFRLWMWCLMLWYTYLSLEFALLIVSSVQFSHSVMSDSLWLQGLQHTRLPCPITNTRSLLKLMSIESVMPSNHHILFCTLSCLQFFPASGSFLTSQFFSSGGQSIGVSASASVLPVNVQDWFPLGWTGWISLQSTGFSRVLQHHSSKASILRRSAFFIVQLSHPYLTTGKTIALTLQTFIGKVMSLLFNMLSRLVIAFLSLPF